MDVSMTSRMTTASLTVAYAKTATKSTDKATGKETRATSEAFELDISAEVTSGKATVDKIADGEKTDYNHTDAIKGLTDDQVKILEDGIAKSQALMIKTMTEQNMKLQGWLDDGIGKLNFSGTIIDAAEFALPAVATTPEEAEKAVADGGDWSIDAVATRIFGMASAIAGGDPERLKAMQDAVEAGCKQAGITWKDEMGEDEMPEITKKTHDEITSRFEKLMAELTAPKTDETNDESKTDAAPAEEA
ncbi:MAG: hypothetical protein ACI4OA_05940 [Selenomonadaceae bacterium]